MSIRIFLRAVRARFRAVLPPARSRALPQGSSPAPSIAFSPIRSRAMPLVLLLTLAGPGAAGAEEDFLPPERAFAFSAAVVAADAVELRFRIAPGYYMYRERFAVSAEPAAALAGEPAYPPGEVKYDPTFEKDMEVYHREVAIRVPLAAVPAAAPSPSPSPGGGAAAPAAGTVTLSVTSQGCADAGLCYPPMPSRVVLAADGGAYRIASAASGDDLARDGAGGLFGGLFGGSASVGGPASTGGPASVGGPVSTGDTAFPAAASAPGASARSAGALDGLLDADDTGLARHIADAGWLRTAGVFFLLGLLLSLTPCVLPMVPILSALIVGRGGAGSPAGAAVASASMDAAGEACLPAAAHAVRPAAPPRWRGLGLAAAYVLGMSVVYTLVGIAAGLSGVGLAAWLQTPWVLGVFAAVLAVLALAMFDVFTFQLPAGLQSRLSERAARIPGGRAAGALLMGAVSALIVGPCVAAPLAGALLYISQTGDVLLGGAALFAMAWGMGVPLLLVGASSRALLPRAGAWMEGVKRLFGVLLLATAWWMLMPVLASWVQMLGWALLAALAAVLLRAFDALPQPAGLGRMLGKAVGLLLALAAVLLVAGVASGGRDLLQPLSHLAAGAREGAFPAGAPAQPAGFQRVRSSAELDAALAAAGRPAMLDFYADWCVSCKEMERFTFSDPAVAAQMSRMLLLQADVTANTPQDRELLRRFRLFGPPGIVFFAADGAELPERVVGFQNAERFGAVLARVLEQGGR